MAGKEEEHKWQDMQHVQIVVPQAQTGPDRLSIYLNVLVVDRFFVGIVQMGRVVFL